MRISAPLPNMGSSTPMNYLLTLTGIAACITSLGWLSRKEHNSDKLDNHIETALQAANPHNWVIHCDKCGWESLPQTYDDAIHCRALHNRLHEYNEKR